MGKKTIITFFAILIFILIPFTYRAILYKGLDNTDKEAIKIINNLGWTVKGKVNETNILFPKNQDNPTTEENRKTWEKFNVNFDDYRGLNLESRTFLLKEKGEGNSKQYAIIYTYNDRVLAGYRQLDGWVPGRSSLFRND